MIAAKAKDGMREDKSGLVTGIGSPLGKRANCRRYGCYPSEGERLIGPSFAIDRKNGGVGGNGRNHLYTPRSP
jgi:hypothetical protein